MYGAVCQLQQTGQSLSPVDRTKLEQKVGVMLRLGSPTQVAWLLHMLIIFITPGCTLSVTIRNDVPRLDSAGAVVDAHSGNVIRVNGTYYLYGERYRNATGMDWQWVVDGYAPKLTVYTSSDLVHWVDHGLCLPDTLNATQWCPSVLYDPAHQRFVAWWAGFQVGISFDGIHFEKLAGIVPTQLGPGWGGGEGTLFVDTDGTGYVIFEASSRAANPATQHRVHIAKLAPNYTATTELVASLFPDTFVEAPSMFKRNGLYYATYGTCCCACREGSGMAVFTATAVIGPWVRQTGPHADANCRNSTAAICPGSAYYPSANPADNAIVPAQGFSINTIETADGETEYVWMGDRWLQGPGNNPKCTNLCYNPPPAACVAGQPDYRVGRDPTYW